MCQLAAEHIAEDLEILVTVSREAGLRCDAVFVQHYKRAEILELGVIMSCDGDYSRNKLNLCC